jgi:hypothetical protein
MPNKIKKVRKIFIAFGLICALAFLYFVTPIAKADVVSSRSDTLSDSRLSTAANHTIQFATPSGVDVGDTITLTMESDFNVASVVLGDVTVEGNAPGGVSVLGQVITITADADTIVAAAGTADIIISNSHITNPTVAGSYAIDIGGTFGDTGKMMVAITEGVTVSATIAETLTVNVSLVNSGDCTVSGGTSVNTTATAVPFGDVNTEAFYNGCQNVEVSTNAGGGYTTTLKKTQLLTSGANTIADGTCDGACSTTVGAAWATATNNGFGYCMDDQGTDDPAATADGDWGTNGCGAVAQYFKLVDGTTPRSIMSSAGEVSDDDAYIGYRLSVDAAQAAGTYSTTTEYITTPTY